MFLDENRVGSYVPNTYNSPFDFETTDSVIAIGPTMTLTFLAQNSDVDFSGDAEFITDLVNVNDVTAVPEPAAMLLAAPAFGALLWFRRRKLG